MPPLSLYFHRERRRMMISRLRSITFKEVFTSSIRNLFINPFWTVSQFIQTVSPILATSFSIADNDLEIVLAGQYINNIPPEAAPKLMPSSNTLASLWGENLNGIAFYVRKKYTEMQDNPMMETSESECPICLETGLGCSSRYLCQHFVCNGCYYRCRQVEFNICPLCRSG